MSKRKKIINDLYDPVAERIILAGMIQHGSSAFFDHSTILTTNSFYFPENQLIFEAIKNLITVENVSKPNIPSILAKLSSIDKSVINQYSLPDYLLAINEDKISIEEISPSVKRVVRLSTARSLIDKLNFAIDSIRGVTGDEPIIDIIHMAEKPISDFTMSLISTEDICSLGEKLETYLQQLAEEQPESLGIPTGYPRYDKLIGGGLRFPGIHMLGARSGVGKSFKALNVAHNICNNGIPVLYLDTELTKEITLGRWSSLITGIPLNHIENGSFAKNENGYKEIIRKAKECSKLPFSYLNISGKNHQDWLSISKRWIMNTVGMKNGKVNPCVIIFDYIKLMNLDNIKDFAEYQYLGQIMTDLHNFAVQYDLPIWSAVQLNREGITKEDQGIVSGSDRIVYLCSSLTIMKDKTPDDLAADPLVNGNKKLIIAKSRFGPGTMNGEYINLKCNLERAKITEGLLNTEIRSTKNLVKNDNDSTPNDDDSIEI
jgi:replicative DNA helicase